MLLLLLSVCSYKWARTLHNRFVLQQSHITRSSRTSRLKPAAVQQNQLYSSWRQRPLACGFTCLRNAPAPAYFKRAMLRTPPPSTVHGSVQRMSSSFNELCCAHLRRLPFFFFFCLLLLLLSFLRLLSFACQPECRERPSCFAPTAFATMLSRVHLQ